MKRTPSPVNPFTPTFGKPPPVLVGREGLIAEFADGLDEGPGAKARATLYGGARGAGKTVLLNAIEAEAIDRGWHVISETASRHLVEDLAAHHLPRLLAEHARRRPIRLTGPPLPAGLGGATSEVVDGVAAAETLRSLVTDLLRGLKQRGRGLLITVDELDAAHLDDLSHLGVVLQDAAREHLDLAVAGAGLPASLDALLRSPRLTILERASRHALGAVMHGDARSALEIPIRDGGRSIRDPELEVAASATSGYPLMIQLVGHNAWRQRPNRVRISMDDVAMGVAAAERRFEQLVHGPTLRDLSAVDRAFLVAMADDDGASRVADVAARMGVDINFASQYRIRLLRRQVISARRRGYVDFALPYLRAYVRRHAAMLKVDA